MPNEIDQAKPPADAGSARVGAAQPRPPRSIESALAPVAEVAASTQRFLSVRDIRADIDGVAWSLPRYVFIGPTGGDDPIRIGIFAGIHGDEPEGVHAAVRFITLLEKHPEVATGYSLFFYPMCNPRAFEARLRLLPSGKDLNREFWRNSQEPEVILLESELRNQRFQGIISLHTDDSASGFYGYAHGATITRHLLDPALAAAGEFIPRNTDPRIDGFSAEAGIIYEGYEGILRAPPRVRPRPFEITLETPKAAPEYLKEAAFIAALKAILLQYQQFIAYSQNL